MRHVTLYEYGVLRPLRAGETQPEDDSWERVVPPRWYDKLRRFDLRRGEEDQAFRWEHNRARAQQWVGVIQLAGITLEILPKVEHDERAEKGVRGNLLWFLSLAGVVPCRERDIARLRSRPGALLEALAALFAGRLRDELFRGMSRAYTTREENLRRFKGRLVVPAQIAHNAAHRERFYCRFDEFSEDTNLNQVLRCACAVLARQTAHPGAQEALVHCLEELDGVTPITPVVARQRATQIRIDRQNERFQDLLSFARLILDQESPEPIAGEVGTFSLLFDMNVVFEGFVAGFLRRHVLPEMDGWHLSAQGRDDRRLLLGHKDENAKGGLLLLKPDLLLKGPEGVTVVIDTKWKAIHPRGGTRRKRPPDSDFYQLHAYAHRYDANWSALLYPQAFEPVQEDYRVLSPDGTPSGKSGRHVSLRTMDLHRDFSNIEHRSALRDALRAMVLEGAQLPR